MVNLKSEMTRYDTHKEHPCHTKRHSFEMHLAQGQSYRHDKRQHYQGLQRTLLKKHTFYPHEISFFGFKSANLPIPCNIPNFPHSFPAIFCADVRQFRPDTSPHDVASFTQRL